MKNVSDTVNGIIFKQKRKSRCCKGKIFTKLGRELLVAVKQGGPDPAR